MTDEDIKKLREQAQTLIAKENRLFQKSIMLEIKVGTWPQEYYRTHTNVDKIISRRVYSIYRIDKIPDFWEVTFTRDIKRMWSEISEKLSLDDFRAGLKIETSWRIIPIDWRERKGEGNEIS
jgi:hypothetical protein